MMGVPQDSANSSIIRRARLMSTLSSIAFHLQEPAKAHNQLVRSHHTVQEGATMLRHSPCVTKFLTTTLNKAGGFDGERRHSISCTSSTLCRSMKASVKRMFLRAKVMWWRGWHFTSATCSLTLICQLQRPRPNDRISGEHLYVGSVARLAVGT